MLVKAFLAHVVSPLFAAIGRAGDRRDGRRTRYGRAGAVKTKSAVEGQNHGTVNAFWDHMELRV
jgi:hypothetical protein